MVQDREIEAKFLNVDVEDVRGRLSALGFQLTQPEHILRRRIFLFPGSGEDKWVRVRVEYDGITMALKHVESAAVDGVRELELRVDDFDRACRFALEVGLVEASYQENGREKWVRDGVQITIDRWPGLETFVEIEAQSGASVRETAELLGFDYGTAAFGGVDAVYEVALGIPRAVFNQYRSVTFDNPPTGS